MNNKIKMSIGLINLLVMVHSHKQFLINENMFKQSHNLPCDKDWYPKTQKFFNAIDDAILNKYGLCKNINSFDAVLDFKITAEMLNTEADELDKFEF